MISRTHIDASSLYHLGIILQSPFHYCVTIRGLYCNPCLAESPTTTVEGQQIHNSLDGSIATAIASKPTADDENEDDMSTDWAIEGVGGLEGDALRHMNAFYVLLEDLFCQKNCTSVLLTREGPTYTGWI